MRQITITDEGLFAKNCPKEVYGSQGKIDDIVQRAGDRQMLVSMDGARTGFPLPAQYLDQFLNMLDVNSIQELRGQDVKLYHDKLQSVLYGIGPYEK